jgi:Putative zinc-finger
VTCPEQRVLNFLAGELSPDEEHLFDEHLLGCESCWRTVQADRAARLALEQLREPAPVGLQGRVALSVALAAGEAEAAGVVVERKSAPSFVRRAMAAHRFRLVAAASLLVVVAVGSFSWLAASRAPAPEPAQLAAVVAMMTPDAVPTTALRAGEHLVIAGQHLVVRGYELEGTEEVVATSARPFPVPPTSHLLAGSSSRAWMATKGRLSMYGVNKRSGGESMFLVADMPMAEMPQLAARLKLI